MKYKLAVAQIEESQGKNSVLQGEFFENFLRRILSKEGWEIKGNVQFTGMEIDLLCKHKTRIKDTLYVECKSGKNVSSTDIMAFAYKTQQKKAKHGYFVHLKELQKQAAGVALETDQETLTFIGPSDILDLAVNHGLITRFNTGIVPDDATNCELHLCFDRKNTYYVLSFGRGTKLDKLSFFDTTTLSCVNEKIEKDVVQRIKIACGSVENTLEYIEVHQINIFNSTSYIPSLKEEALIEFKEYTHIGNYNESTHVIPYIQEIDGKYNKPKLSAFQGINIDRILPGVTTLVRGRTKAGKSVFLYEFAKILQRDRIPLFIYPENISKASSELRFLSELNKVYSRQYGSGLNNSFDHKLLVLIIDDVHEIIKVYGSKFRTVVNTCVHNNIKILSTTDNLEYYKVSKILSSSHDAVEPKNLCHFEILPLGAGQIEELVELKLLHEEGSIYNTNGANSRLNLDETVKSIKTIIGHNIIAPYPFHIVSALSVIRAGKPVDNSFTIHGSYYEMIIKQSIMSVVNDASELPLYTEIMEKISMQAFTFGLSSLDQKKVLEIIQDQLDFIGSSLPSKDVASILTKARYICMDDAFKFYHPYIYYYYTSSYIANHLDSDIQVASGKILTGIEILRLMLQKSYIDEYTQIFLFISHKTRDARIFDLIIEESSLLSDYSEPEIIGSIISSLAALRKELPKEIVKLSESPEERRGKNREELDKRDIQDYSKRRSSDDRDYGYALRIIGSANLDYSQGSLDLLEVLLRSVKMIDIVGNYMRAYWAKTSKENKTLLLRRCVDISNHALHSYLSALAESKQDVLDFTFEEIYQKHPKSNRDRIKLAESVVEHFVFNYASYSIFGVSNRLSYSVASERIRATIASFEPISPVEELYKYTMLLGYSSIINPEKLAAISKTTGDSSLLIDALRRTVIHHYYKYDQPIATKEAMQKNLGVQIDNQRKIDASSTSRLS